MIYFHFGRFGIYQDYSVLVRTKSCLAKKTKSNSKIAVHLVVPHYQNFALWSTFFLLILVTTIGGRQKSELCFLPGWLKWTLLPKERYGNSHSGCGSNTQPSIWESDTLPLNYCRPWSTCKTVGRDAVTPSLFGWDDLRETNFWIFKFEIPVFTENLLYVLQRNIW